jgi:nitrogen fixation/metabolism regulation signal transduction histidine kinase
LLIKQFRVIRLKHNVLINWPYHDELGLLVREYNEMIIKVEDMAAKLASNEREAAWRELALQVAHEIKNPLTPMKLNIQYLQSAIKSGRPDVPELTAKLTNGLIDQIENLNVIASEFAHFAKMPEAQPEVLGVHDMLLSIVALFHKEKGVSINLLTPAQPLQIIMDKGYFMRIFTNLIKNAIQAIPLERPGRIDISYKRMDKKVIILVKDNGTGIPPELRDKMFVPYFTTKSSGTGIGLSMSKNIVEHSNGKIWFETETGAGTTFFVQFPLI